MKHKQPPHSCSVLWFIAIFALLGLQILGISLFAFGFFPMKVTLTGHATIQDIPEPFVQDAEDRSPSKPLFGRLVMMVVDALSEPIFYANSSQMTYTRRLIETNRAMFFTAQAQAPTVTLPRLKALTSGGVPTFLDFLFNFGGDALKEDNIITQFKRHNRKMIFYGDDTWLKLFPDHFYRHEGTTSFFVADTIEVDNNVTRNVWPELERDDWDVMIVHYLGLDHVGHLEGPQSNMMEPKQREMDGIVERIHKRILAHDAQRSSQRLPTLFLLCSDHGMNEMGNHGGSSLPETSSILVFMSSLLDKTANKGVPTGALAVRERPVVSQIDLAPTLSVLFGQPIPRNSLGGLIAPLLHRMMGEKEYLRALQINAHQLLQLVKAKADIWSITEDKPMEEETELLIQSLARAHEAHTSWLRLASENAATQRLAQFETAAESYLRFIEGVKSKFSHLMSGDTTDMMVMGTAVLGFVAICSIVLVTVFLWMQYRQNKEQEKRQQLLAVKKLFSIPNLFVMVGTLVHVATLAASSMVEEEHQTWYFLTTSLHFLYVWESFKGSFALDHLAIQKGSLYVAVLLLDRIERGWNQTGIKWLGTGDYGKWLLEEQNGWLLTVLNVIAVCAPCIYALFILERHRSLNLKLKRISQLLYLYGLLALMSYRWKFWLPIPVFRGDGFWGTDDDVWKARVFYIIILCLTIIQFLPCFIKRVHTWQRKFAELKVLVDLWAVSLVLLLQLLHKPHNLFLFVIVGLKFKLFLRALALRKRQYVMKNKSSTIEKDIGLGILAMAWMGSSSFFALGNSNSLASIDISGAYTGLAEYHPVPCAVLTFIITYSAPFLCLFLSARFLLSYFEELEIWLKGLLLAKTKLDKVEGMLCQSFAQMNVLVCLLSQALHSFRLVVFALLMQHFRHHLFIWSVFSPKFVYLVLFCTIFEACTYLFILVFSS